MTLRSVQSRSKRKAIAVFDYTDEEERIEKVSKKLLRKFDSPVTKKSSCAIDKYDFLRCCECFFSEFPVEFLYRFVFGCVLWMIKVVFYSWNLFCWICVCSLMQELFTCVWCISTILEWLWCFLRDRTSSFTWYHKRTKIWFLCNTFLLQLRRKPKARVKKWTTSLLMLKVKVRKLYVGGQFSTTYDEIVLGKSVEFQIFRC